MSRRLRRCMCARVPTVNGGAHAPCARLVSWGLGQVEDWFGWPPGRRRREIWWSCGRRVPTCSMTSCIILIGESRATLQDCNCAVGPVAVAEKWYGPLSLQQAVDRRGQRWKDMWERQSSIRIWAGTRLHPDLGAARLGQDLPGRAVILMPDCLYILQLPKVILAMFRGTTWRHRPFADVRKLQLKTATRHTLQAYPHSWIRELWWPSWTV